MMLVLQITAKEVALSILTLLAMQLSIIPWKYIRAFASEPSLLIIIEMHARFYLHKSKFCDAIVQLVPSVFTCAL